MGLARIDAIPSVKLRLVSSLNLGLPVVALLSLWFDVTYLGPSEAIGGLVMYLLTFVLLWFVVGGNKVLRWITVGWLGLLALTVGYIAAVNFIGQDGVPRGLELVVGGASLLLGIYFVFAIYVLTFDGPTADFLAGSSEE